MAWPDDPLPAIRHELHFGDRLVRCFAERPPQPVRRSSSSAWRATPTALALIDGDARLTYAQLAERRRAPGREPRRARRPAQATGWRCCSATARPSWSRCSPARGSARSRCRSASASRPPGLAYMLVQSGAEAPDPRGGARRPPARARAPAPAGASDRRSRAAAFDALLAQSRHRVAAGRTARTRRTWRSSSTPRAPPAGPRGRC